jgi:hypothetical protein
MPDEEEGLIVNHRGIPGQHTIARDCWCGPIVLRADDEVGFKRLREDPSWNRPN